MATHRERAAFPGSSKSPTQINPNILLRSLEQSHQHLRLPGEQECDHHVLLRPALPTRLPTGGNANLGGLPGHMPTQYVEHFSLGAEYDFGHAVVANLGYEGGLGRHEMYNYDATALGDIMGAAQNPLVNSVNTFGSNGWSSNNMMLAGLKHQFSHTFYAEGQFTWAHSMDTNSGPYSRDPYLYNPRILLRAFRI